MIKRRNIGARLRFEILKRDRFRCVYCGAEPGESELRVDHVKPVAHGGDNDPINLVTACHPCNAGKAAVLLGDRDEPVHVLTHFQYQWSMSVEHELRMYWKVTTYVATWPEARELVN